MVFNFVFHHVPGENNQIVDCFSRLTREIKEAEHYSLCDTILADHDRIETKTGFSVKAIRNSKTPTEDDPWVEHLWDVAMSDRDDSTMVQLVPNYEEHPQSIGLNFYFYF